METGNQNSDPFNENQSLQVLKEMITISQKKLKNNGILFIVWGWVSFITQFTEFILKEIPHTHLVSAFKGYLNYALALFGLGFTIWHIYKKSSKAITYIDISLRYVWISMFAGMVLINLIQANVLHKITFELQLPIFMVLTSIALTVTGGILRYKIIVAGGIVFVILAYVASFFPLHSQLLIHSIAWAVGFIIPGHILYANRNK